MAKGTATVENIEGHSQLGSRSLAIHSQRLAPGRAARVATPTFTPSKEISDYFDNRGYALLASPTLYDGQTIKAAVSAAANNELPLTAALYVTIFGPNDELIDVKGPEVVLAAGAGHELEWPLALSDRGPIAKVGVEVSSGRPADGTVYLDYLTWSGTPTVSLNRPEHNGEMWRKAWVNGVDIWHTWGRLSKSYRLVQNEGCGLLMQGTREWTDYDVSAEVTPEMVKSAGIGARVQGMRRYYGLLLGPDGKAQLVKALDGVTVLAEKDIDWRLRGTYNLRLQVKGTQIEGWVDGQKLFDVTDDERPLEGGAIALIIEEGLMDADQVVVKPIE